MTTEQDLIDNVLRKQADLEKARERWGGSTLRSMQSLLDDAYVDLEEARRDLAAWRAQQ